MGLVSTQVFGPVHRVWGLLFFREQPVAAGVDRQGDGEGRTTRPVTDIFDEYADFIRAVIHFQACGRFDEEDFFQEFFLLLVHKPVPMGVRNVKGYLYRAITHHVVDLIRRQQCYRRNLKKYSRETRISINNRPAENALIDDDQRAAVLAYVIRHLHEREAEAFTLKYRDNCTIPEIAARMGVDKRTVSRYLSDGLKRLQRTLAIE